MNDKLYSEADLLKAWEAISHQDEISFEEYFDELRKPKEVFAEGQVVYDNRYAHYTILPDVDTQCRSLDQTEVGPNWMPRGEAVMKLREAMQNLALSPQRFEGYWKDYASRAVNDFDNEVSDETK